MENKNESKKFINIKDTKFKVTTNRTTVAVIVEYPEELQMRLSNVEEVLPEGITIVSDSKSKVTFVGQFVHTNEVKELCEFKEMLLHAVRVYISAAIAYDTYKDTLGVLSSTLKNIGLDMAAVVYKPEQK